MMRRFIPAAVAAALALTILPSGASAPVSYALPALAGNGDADARSTTVAPTLAAARAANALHASVRDAVLRWNTRFGTVASVMSRDGYLTPGAGGLISSAEAESIARGWLAEHRAMFGLPSGATLATTRNAALPDGGQFALVFRQMYGDIPTFAGGTIGVNLTRDGRISSVWADTPPAGSLNATPAITAADALRVVARREGVTSLKISSLGQRAGGDRLAIFAAGGAYGTHNARLVAFPTASGPRLAWRVFFAKAGDQMLSTAVDATTGVELYRHNEVAYEKGDSGRVYRNYPGAKHGGGAELVSFEGDHAASPQGWLAGMAPGPATTIGNNAIAFTDWTWPTLAAGGFGPAVSALQINPNPSTMPVSATRSLDYPFTNEWSKSCGAAVTSQVTGDLVQSPSYVQDRDPSVVNGFYFANVIHDFAYKHGFTEAFGNMQTQNFSGKGKAFDAVRIMTQAGIASGNYDNAFMFTPADGGEPTQFADPTHPTYAANYYPPFSGMFLWKPVDGFDTACVDGSQDASVVYHEYTHGISNRMTGGPDDADALSAAQSGAMGEAWSDFVATLILDTQGLLDRPVVGPYATHNSLTGIRNFALNANPLTYGDMGYGLYGPEVHDDGEIWLAALWDARTAFALKYGKAKGDEMIAQLVFDGLATQPRLPDMLEARDAIIKAAEGRFPHDAKGAADRTLLWQAFARRGMGYSAHSRDASDTSPRPAFDAPTVGFYPGLGMLTDPRETGGVRGVVRDVGGQPLQARIYVGLASGKPAPAAVSSPSNGSFQLPMTAGLYQVTAGAPGYGMQKIGSLRVANGKTTSVAFTLKRNLASVGWGARVVGGEPAGSTGIALIDDHDFSGQPIDVGKPMVVALAGSSALVTAVGFSPRPASADVLSAPSLYTVQLSADGKKWKTALQGGVHLYKPRPTAPAWAQTVRSIPPTRARFARVLVGSTYGGTASAVVGGLQIYGSAAGMKATAPRAAAPFVDPNGVILAPNAAAPAGSVTIGEFALTCDATGSPSVPLTQGVDAYIVQLPAGAGDGIHLLATKGGNETGRDLDVYFFDDACQPTGRIATPSADESGSVPPGSTFAAVVLYAGSTQGFRVSVTSTLEKVVPPKGVGYAKPPASGGGTGAPVTVVRNYVGVIGDVGELNCGYETSESAPAVGAVCFDVKPGQTINVKIADQQFDNVSGAFALHDANSNGVDQDVTEFCGGFGLKVPDGIVQVTVYLDEAEAPLRACHGSPASTGVATAVIK